MHTERGIGPGNPAWIIAEIGINHNGSVAMAKEMVKMAKECGCDAVKFQKRTVDVVYTEEELAKPRESPFGTTNGDLKRRLEFDKDQYAEIHECCKDNNIPWFASCWDEQAVNDIETLEPPCYKIASASLTDDDLLRYTAAQKRPLLLSTGMSRIEDVDHAVEVLDECGANVILLHCVSTYPARNGDLNLRCMDQLRSRYHKPVGYSGHEQGLATTVAAVALGACVVERHFTLNRAMYGSDQSASLEPQGMSKLVRDIRAIEEAMGPGFKQVLPAEMQAAMKLRRTGWPTTNTLHPAISQ